MSGFFGRVPKQTYLEKETDTAKERIQSKVQKEDFLLKQIDEFKEKAKQLQNMLTTKETKVEELQGILEEREEKAKKLQNVLNGRRQEADELIKGVQAQIDALILRVDEQLKVMDETVSSEIDTLDERISEHVAEMNSNSRQEMAEIQKQIEKFTWASEKKIEEQSNVIEIELKGLTAQLDELVGKVDKVAEAVKGQDSQELENLKAELSEKIHSESVKCYRNIQTLVEELEQKIERSQQENKSMRVMKSCFGGVILLSIVNIAGVVAILTHLFGFI